MALHRISHRVTTVVGIMMALLALAFGWLWMYTLHTASDERERILDPYAVPDSPFLHEDEVVFVPSKSTATTTTTASTTLPVERVLFQYVEIVNSCGIHYDREPCVNVRSGPGTDFDAVSQVRNDIVLKVGGRVTRDGEAWYKIVFDEWLRYPERVTTDWYINADYVNILLDEGEKTSWEDEVATTSKRIVVDRSEQKLYAYDGETLIMELVISTGLELNPTPRGTFTVFKKTPSRYMQGPLPGFPASDTYDLPGVPWNLYFTHGGAVIHGAYWHDSFGEPYSHGCVNLAPADARRLYEWTPLGTPVIVQD